MDTLHVGDIGMASASDPVILNHALAHGRTIVTLDADFHSFLALHELKAPSVIRIRIEGLKGSDLASIIMRVARQFGAELEAGAAFQSVRAPPGAGYCP